MKASKFIFLVLLLFLYVSVSALQRNNVENGHEYVDLGLSVNWATCNVGAIAPEGYGDFFAWGEIEPYYDAGLAQDNPQTHWKDNKAAGYDMSTYKYCKGSTTTLTKYCNRSEYGYNGFVDNKTILDPEDDVAHVKWGGSWRMPSKEELEELWDSCTWVFTTRNNVKGYVISSNKPGYTERSIFLPAAGNRTKGDRPLLYHFVLSAPDRLLVGALYGLRPPIKVPVPGDTTGQTE